MCQIIHHSRLEYNEYIEMSLLFCFWFVSMLVGLQMPEQFFQLFGGCHITDKGLQI
jgi:hypothetical protein